MTEDDRPDPDLLLSHLTQEKEKAHRGRLKIFFGSSAGVGKTYAMLKAARERSEQGDNVLVGIVETHGRPETEKLIEGLRILQPLEIPYRGLTLKELALNAVLTRKPDILLVDELAHTNAPGTRHPKRWNDVIEILDAGIDVYTTLNVQHIESLSDLVASTTGVWVKETVPDTVFDLADDVVLVDIDEDDLIQRLHEGKVYVAPGAVARAADNFFKKSNLSALREIALRRTADRVDALRKTDEKENEGQALAEKILVCFAIDTMAAQLVRTTKRLATALKAPWEAIHVQRPTLLHHAASDNARFLGTIERMIERMGGTLSLLRGNNIVDEIISYAHDKKFTKIVIGKDSRRTLRNFFSNFFINRLIHQSGSIDVYVVTGENTRTLLENRKTSFFSNFKPLNYVLTLIIACVFTLPAIAAPGLLTPTDQVLLYLIGIVIVAERMDFNASLFYAILAACAFHLFVFEPHHRFSLDDRAYLLTFFIMLVTSYIIATQASRLRAQAFLSRTKEKQAQALLALTRQLTSTNGRFPVAELVANHIKETMGSDVTVWMMNADNHPAVVLGDLPQDSYYKDFGALEWCFENNQMAGSGTSTLPSAGGAYLPLSIGNESIGVLGVFPNAQQETFSHEALTMLETLAGLLATALKRVHAAEISQQVILEKESKRLKQTFVSAVTDHFQYTKPSEAKLNKEILQDISETLTNETASSDISVQSFLASKPFNISSVQLNKRPTSLVDLVNHVLEPLKEAMKKIEVKIDFPSDLPDILVDTTMLEQALIIFLMDATEKAYARSVMTLSALRQEREVKLLITISTGSGDAQDTSETVVSLASFASKGKEKDNQIDLAVAAGIFHLHGGKTKIENQADGKINYSLALPIA